MGKKGKGKIFKILFLLFLAGAGIAGFIGWKYYQKIYKPNISIENKKSEFLYIPTGSTLSDVSNLLYEKNYLLNRNSFEWVAEQKNYANRVYPGKYLIRDRMSNNELVNLLRSGAQVPVKVTFNNVRTKKELAGKITKNIEADSARFLAMLNDKEIIQKYGFNKETIITLFLPNTYEFYWNTSEEKLIERMAKEYKAFWNDERKAKARNIGLSQSEVATLASIVQSESVKRDEQPKIAGVYMNRLEKGMLLQADPTVVFALGDFSIRRVLNIHKEVESPYNTYKHTGLPPGPITLPEISSLNAVLDYEKHDYIYFCAKEDFSGYHSFAKTYNQHLQNARKYQQALNRKGIYK